MGVKAKQTIKLSVASVLLFALVGHPTVGTARIFPLYMTSGDTTAAPTGWFQFCADYKPECEVEPSQPKQVALSSYAWKELLRINGWVNSHIKPMTDMAHWGVIERWNYPDDGYGDCEDYALLKRRMLIQEGWPREALLMTVVRDHSGEGHAVLTVETDKGEFILDNQREGVLLWSETGYEFLSRQSQSDPNKWVSIYQSAGNTLIAKAEHNKREHVDLKGRDPNQIVVSLEQQPLDGGRPVESPMISPPATVIAAASDADQPLLASNAVNVATTEGTTEKVESESEQKAVQPGWGVQLIGNSSEAAALASYRQLQKTYQGVLGSQQPTVIKTNVGVGSHWYRVRIAAVDRSSAEALCSNLRAAGGSCLIQPD